MTELRVQMDNACSSAGWPSGPARPTGRGDPVGPHYHRSPISCRPTKSKPTSSTCSGGAPRLEYL